ncbi:hypothetical protein KXD40_003279 [Peronospora effusa]|uniref:Uncharacterized protein n=1 Tax=Peronospora effusa TaxID=542832 RepID=A0A3M6VH40_9STRA|nr:hypothetical protein DD238_004782 [Peronospora effusa]UIZ29796.1 hypothetical protein KXD40_003279 [Peronospora effusa]
MGLMKALYRELVGAATRFDRHASLRALITTELYESPLDPNSRSRLPHIEAFNRCLLRYLGGRHFYLPDPQRPTLLQLIREEFHTKSKHTMDSDRLDTAFVALRAFNDTLAESKALELPPKTDWETRTIEGVQLAENVTSGVFLVAHPLLEGIFSRSVVLVTEHKVEGSKGFIVNKVSEKPLGRTFQVPSRVMRAFGTSTVRKGGPVFSKNAEVRWLSMYWKSLYSFNWKIDVCRDEQVLHGRADFGGQRVQTTNFPSANDPSLFVGVDLDAAARAIDDGNAKHTDVVFMSGVSAWSTGQLDTEVKQGSWIPMNAPVFLALNAPAELWQDMMRTIGGEYAEMSGMPSMEEEE